MAKTYDWHALAISAGSISGFMESGGTREAQIALAKLVGEENLVGAVDYYLTGVQGSELVRSVLRLLKPEAAMSRCYEIYKSSDDRRARAIAVELLRSIADRRALPWAHEFIADLDDTIQMWGASLVDQLLWDSSIEVNEATALLDVMERHPNPAVRERHSFIMKYLKDRIA